LSPVVVPGLAGARVTTVAQYGRGRHALGTSDGRVIPLEVKFEVTFKDGVRTVTPEAVFGEAAVLDPGRGRAIRRLAVAAPAAGPLTVAQVGPTDLIVQTVVERKALIGASRREESLQPLPVSLDGEVSALALDGRGEDLFLGTSRGQVLRYDLRDPATPAAVEVVTPGTGAPVTTLGFLIGDRTLVVGDAGGRVSTWQVVPPPDGGVPRLTRIYEFAAHDAAVTAIAASRRDKGFITADSGGLLHVSYGTSGQTLLRLAAPTADLRSIVFAPKADGLLAIGGDGRLGH
ncbi:MAG: ABC transporter permease subunit, partial [Candidatus Rokuibacteriota bacterium]